MVKHLDKVKEVRRAARERLKPPRTRMIEDKRRKLPKHKKALKDLNEQE
jgi:hypothetical protein